VAPVTAADLAREARAHAAAATEGPWERDPWGDTVTNDVVAPGRRRFLSDLSNADAEHIVWFRNNAEHIADTLDALTAEVERLRAEEDVLHANNDELHDDVASTLRDIDAVKAERDALTAQMNAVRAAFEVLEEVGLALPAAWGALRRAIGEQA
jgi:hypothetical protein